MNNCKCNDFIGLCNRYLKDSPNTFKADVNIINNILDNLCRELKPHFSGPISLHEFLEKKKGKLSKRYNDAARDVLKNGFNLWKDNDITAFIKNEIYDELKPPRMIMGRNPKFNLLYGTFTTPLEHAMMHLPQISKGKNFLERGEQFFQLIFGNCMRECDFSKYESTQRYELLKLVELGIWRRLLSANDYSLVEKIFYAKMQKRGNTLNGQKFEFWYCRGSGDMDTGLFNTLLTYIACKYFLIYNNIPGDFICDGDDNVISTIDDRDCINTFADFGFDAKIKIRYDYHDVEYCSGKFIQYKPGKFIYVQNVNKLMKNIGVFRKSNFEHCKGVYYHSLGFMYKVIYGDLPLFSDISKFLLRIGKGKHVSTEILDELNPMHTEAFKNTTYNLDIDKNLARVEIAMSFIGSIAELDRCITWYTNEQVSLSAAENKRYNAIKTPRDKLTNRQIDLVYENLTKITEMPERIRRMVVTH